MKRKRMSTVEAVFGTLTPYLGLRKMNIIGIQLANKQMHLAAIVFNLKKLLKFANPKVKSGPGIRQDVCFIKNEIQQAKQGF
ncbi:MAG: hypothetical protein ACI83I_002590 [Bacteroidia bacterium]|jgi:hypothetical protein